VAPEAKAKEAKKKEAMKKKKKKKEGLLMIVLADNFLSEQLL